MELNIYLIKVYKICPTNRGRFCFTVYELQLQTHIIIVGYNIDLYIITLYLYMDVNILNRSTEKNTTIYSM